MSKNKRGLLGLDHSYCKYIYIQYLELQNFILKPELNKFSWPLVSRATSCKNNMDILKKDDSKCISIGCSLIMYPKDAKQHKHLVGIISCHQMNLCLIFILLYSLYWFPLTSSGKCLALKQLNTPF